MIGKISVPRGKRCEPLIYYLFGPGRHEEHTDPHIVAGWRHPAELEPPLRQNGRRDFGALFGLLNQPHQAMGSFGYDRPVWHCSLRAAPDDKVLSDDEWAAIACDAMHRTGLAPYGQEDDAVRWIAVRHGAGHIHLVVMLARQDGRRPSTRNDRYRVREACLAAERRYGLRSTALADRTAPRRPTRAETEKAARRRLDEPPRITLRRHVTTAAASAGSETEFFARLEAAGVLAHPRHSTTNPGQVTGYAVALPSDTGRDGGPVWYGGGKLAADLSWPKVSQRWTRPGPSAVPRITAAERTAIWDHASRTAADAAAHIRALADRPRCRRRRRMGGIRHAARRSRRPRQPHPAAGRRRLRPGSPRPLRTHPGTQPGRRPAAAGRPAARRAGLPDQGPGADPHRADHPAGRARRGGRGPARRPAARRPGRRRPCQRRTAVRRRLPRPSSPAARISPAADSGAARRLVVPQGRARPHAARSWAAPPWPAEPAAAALSGTAPAARPRPVTRSPPLSFSR
jgi:hypothetical protein